MVPPSPNFICHFFTKAIPKGLPFGLWLYVLRLYNVRVLYCIPGSPEMTDRGLRDLKLSNYNNNGPDIRSM